MRFGLAFRAFWSVLTSRPKAIAVEKALTTDGTLALPSSPPPEKPKVAPSPVPTSTRTSRSDALSLLSALQREARWIDLVQESLDGYSDAQVGAAARDVLRDSKKVLDRMFDLGPVIDGEEGTRVAIDANASALRVRILGNASKASNGILVHRGWQAKQCRVPEWTGSESDKMILSPAEFETE